MTKTRKLRVFLCHASQDKPVVRELYQRLLVEGWIDPWLDEKKLLPGQDWDMEIEKAVEAADAVIVCLSTNSVSKEGYIQRELRFVLDIALEKPENTIFVVPLRLDECELPRRLRSWHYVDYFPIDQVENAYGRLSQALEARSNQILSKMDLNVKAQPGLVEDIAKTREDREPLSQRGKVEHVVDSQWSKGSETVNVGGSILQILYFSLSALDVLAPSDTLTKILMGIFAILASIVFFFKKQIPTTIVFKISTVAYLLLFGLGYRIEELIPFAPYLTGLTAIISAGILVLNVQKPKRPLYFSSISFALFLFLVGIYYISTNIVGYPPVLGEVDTLIFITSIITSVLLIGGF